jgi:hypothetical protein
VADLVRICRALVVEPLDVVGLAEPADRGPGEPAPLVFDHSRRPWVLVLRNAAGRCPFLLHTNDGLPVCGLGSLAPAGCRVNEDATDQSALARHATLVAAWNAYASRWPPDVGLGLEDAARYLLDAGTVLADGSESSSSDAGSR